MSGPSGVESFRGWVVDSVSRPPESQAPTDLALRGAEDLREMLEIVREAELTCIARFADLKRRSRHERQQRDAPDAQRRIGIIVDAERDAWWEGRISWLQKARQYLEQEQEERV